ncbi:MAG: adenylate kinase family protein [Thermoplasmata archaeon]|nr:MAG: adenylate kinase family protein [Thermoplasmata archaeon]
MLVALSGTPGVGKTTVTQILRERGHRVLAINQVAEENNLVVGYDEERETKIIDVDALDDFIVKEFENDNIIIEGHLSHLLSVDLTIILRCDPFVLKERLKGKGWSEKKVKENIGAEILDVIKVEALENMERVFEVDTTLLPPQKVADSIEEILNGKYKEPNINWLDKYEYLLF